MVSTFLNISTDTTLGGSSASDSTVSSQKAVKAYADTKQDILRAGIDLEIVQGILPSGYTEVEYLEIATTNVYFDTNVNADIDTEIEITASNVTSNSSQLIVAQSESGSATFRIAKATANQRIMGTLGSQTITDSNTSGVDKFTARLNRYAFYVNGNLIGSFTNQNPTLTNIGKFEIFRGKYGNSIYYAAVGTRIHSAKIKKSDGYYYFIPCRRNSDNKLGIYDVVNNTFILPSGSGTLIAGNNVGVSAVINFTNESGYQKKSNLVTSVSSSSTDSQYPSAKLFYDTCGDIETLINAL